MCSRDYKCSHYAVSSCTLVGSNIFLSTLFLNTTHEPPSICEANFGHIQYNRQNYSSVFLKLYIFLISRFAPNDNKHLWLQSPLISSWKQFWFEGGFRKYVKCSTLSKNLLPWHCRDCVSSCNICMQSNKIHKVILMSKFMLARHVSDLIGPSSGAFCTSCIRRLWYVVIRVLLDTSSRYKVLPTTL